MKYLLMLVFVSCASNQPVLVKKEISIKTLSQKMDQCISKYIGLDLKAQEAIEICKTIYGK